MKTQKISLVFLFLFTSALGLKILISGDFDDARQPYFHKLAHFHSNDKSTDHQYVQLSPKSSPLKLETITPRLSTFGIPLSQKDQLKWIASKPELDNVMDIELA